MSGKTVIFVHNETKTGWEIKHTGDERTKNPTGDSKTTQR